MGGSVKAVNCFKCIHYTPMPDWDWRSPCGKGHKPRFYKSKGIRWEYDKPDHWGHKRVCTDFRGKPPRPEVIVEYGYGRGLPMATCTPVGYILVKK
jgi:hypothetical protein